MDTKAIEQMQQPPINVPHIERTFHLIQEAVTFEYVATNSDHLARERLERHLVTLLAAVVRNPDAQKSADERIKYLAELLISAVREAE